MLVISLVLSAVLLLIANVVGHKSRRLGVVCAICGVGAFLGWPCIMFPAYFLSALLMAGAALVFWFMSRGSLYFKISSVLTVVGCHLVIGILAYSSIKDRQELRLQYPIESLGQRLAYEGQQDHLLSGPTNPSFAFRAPDLPAPEVSQSLKNLEEQFERDEHSMRRFGLMMLHKSAVDDFINSPGFGVSRSMELRMKDIELPVATPIPLAYPEYEPSSGVNESSTSLPGDLLKALPQQDALSEMHRASIVDFANAKGFGYVKDREHVRGFQAHQFRELPHLPDEKTKTQRWQIQNLQLVSLLKHAEPAVYLSENLPRMDELREAKTRPLDRFEKEALDGLRTGAELKVDSSAERIRMLGSIRAVKQCLECHQVQRGDLLGAFTYTLVRSATAP